MGCCVTCCKVITEKAIRSTDTAEDIKAKRYGIPVCIAISAILAHPLLDPIDDVAEVGHLLAAVVGALFLFAAFTNTMSATNALKVGLLLLLLCVYSFDW
eukprot:Hpha_TRINITY_DN17161_c0_g1::TRINITY_DN17161_c0_g1_i1::g.146798::m.146798